MLPRDFAISVGVPSPVNWRVFRDATVRERTIGNDRRTEESAPLRSRLSSVQPITSSMAGHYSLPAETGTVLRRHFSATVVQIANVMMVAVRPSTRSGLTFKGP